MTVALHRRNLAWDGLRALALAGVLVYHVEGQPLSGGFLGVSLFFTLSGYLITSLLVAELSRSDRVDVVAFWSRRFRRLLPAMVLAIALAGAFIWWAADANQRDAFDLDAFAAVTGWSNWRFLATGMEYGGQSISTSPLLHTWSLSIELQAYLVIPLVVWGAWRLGGRRTATFAITVLLIGSFIAGIAARADSQVWYLGTHVRIAEILVGSLAALAFHGTSLERARRFAERLAPFALVAIAVMWWTATTSSAWLPLGGFLGHAVATMVVVLAVEGASRYDRVLSMRPFTALGTISYGMYLFHWPIYLWITPRLLGIGIWPTTAVRVAGSLVLATLSFVLVERLFSPRSARPIRSVTYAGAVMAVTCLAAAVMTPVGTADDRITLTDGLVAPPSSVGRPVGGRVTPPTGDSPTAPATGGTDSSAGSDDSPPTTVAELDPFDHLDPASDVDPSRPAGAAARPTVLMVGDSTLATLGSGVQRWSSYLGGAEVYVNGWMACPIALGGDIRWNNGIIATPDPGCEWRRKRADDLDALDPDLVVVLSGMWELTDRRLPGGDGFTDITEPEMTALVESAFAEFTDLMTSRGAEVLWLLHPAVRNSIYAGIPGPLPEEDLARLDRLNDIIVRVAAERDGVWTYDLRSALIDRYGDAVALANRRDGFHWTDAGADIDGAWLAPVITAVAATADARRQGRVNPTG
jgi:peptidoglycan/LPS O-acetylase OafA/YrhL